MVPGARCRLCRAFAALNSKSVSSGSELDSANAVGVGGGRYEPLGAGDLKLAKAALGAFDLPLVVEHFAMQGPSLLLQRHVLRRTPWQQRGSACRAGAGHDALS